MRRVFCQRFVYLTHVPTDGTGNQLPQVRVDLSGGEADLRGGEAVEGRDPFLHRQEVIGVGWVLGEVHWNVSGVGVREHNLETLDEIDRARVAPLRRHGDGKVASVVGARKERLCEALLDLETGAGYVIRLQGAQSLDGVVADRAVHKVLPNREIRNGMSQNGRVTGSSLGH